MKCEYHKQESPCNFASRVYGKKALELTEDEIDYTGEFCTGAQGVGCRDKEGLTKTIGMRK